MSLFLGIIFRSVGPLLIDSLGETCLLCCFLDLAWWESSSSTVISSGVVVAVLSSEVGLSLLLLGLRVFFVVRHLQGG